jgi:holin-like protein
MMFYVIGQIVSYLLQKVWPAFFIPGTIIGMLLFFIILVTRSIKIQAVDEVGSFLSSNMSFFFIPAAVSILEYYEDLKSVFLKVVLLIFVTTLIGFFFIAISVRLTIKIQEKLSKGENHE